MKVNDMTDREILIWIMGELRGVKKLLTNHLAHHEKQDDRRWKLYIGLLIAVIGGVVVALLT